MRAAVREAQNARDSRESDAKRAAELAEQLASALRVSMQAELTERQMAVMQRVAAEMASRDGGPCTAITARASGASPGAAPGDMTGAGAPMAVRSWAKTRAPVLSTNTTCTLLLSVGGTTCMLTIDSACGRGGNFQWLQPRPPNP